jgi:hypothetical protein
MNPKLHIALKEFEKIDSIEESIADIKLILEGFTHVIQSIYDNKPELGDGEVFIETLSIKILLATQSILQISDGIFISSHEKVATIKYLDISSINILTRSIIEAFLTLEYLYYNDLQESERIFRLYIWRISGYKSRQNFFQNRENIKNNVKEKLDTEIIEMNELLQKVESSVHYKELNKHHLSKLDKYGLPRINSWQDLLENSILKARQFSVAYKLYSNYAHSEFISLIQMNGATELSKGSETNNLSLKNSLRVIKMINCVAIILLKDKFQCTHDSYENLDYKLKEKIVFWYNLSIVKHYT